MSSELRLGLLGCGVVGQGVLRLVDENARAIEARLGRPVKVQRVYLREGSKARGQVPASLITSLVMPDVWVMPMRSHQAFMV